MIYSDAIRQFLLGATAAVFLAFTIWSLVGPRGLANMLGYELRAPNGNSEFGAIYTGVFIGQALLCLLALVRVRDATLGDLVAVFLLLQPVGRLPPLLRYGAPQGFLRVLLVAEVLSGLLLLAVRPSAA